MALTFSDGAVPITSEAMLFERASMLAPELGMDVPHLETFTNAVREQFSAEALREWLAAADSNMAIDLTRRFSAIEGDTSNPGLKGLGRVTAASFSRLGGALHKHAAKAGVDKTDVVNAVERTVQASYLALLLGADKLAARARLTDVEEVWQQWIPNAYIVPEPFLEKVDGVCGFVEFWLRAFERWNMPKAVKELKKSRSKVNGAIGGLCGVGIALAIAERERA